MGSELIQIKVSIKTGSTVSAMTPCVLVVMESTGFGARNWVKDRRDIRGIVVYCVLMAGVSFVEERIKG